MWWEVYNISKRSKTPVTLASPQLDAPRDLASDKTRLGRDSENQEMVADHLGYIFMFSTFDLFLAGH